MEKAKTIERALRVLSCFTRAEHELNASELARRLGLSRTSVVRMLSTLEASGFVERRPGDSRYRVGLAAFRVGCVYVATNPLVGFADSCLEILVKESGCTAAYLGVMEGDEAIIIAHREGSHPIRFVWTTGDRLPICTTAYGKAMLALLPTILLDRIVGKKKLRGLTAHSLRTRAQLDVQLREIRKRGWAIAEDESSVGIMAVGAAVVDHTGCPIAGISISYVRGTLDRPPNRARPEHLGSLVAEQAAVISARASEYAEYGKDLRRPTRSGHGGRRLRAVGPARSQ